MPCDFFRTEVKKLGRVTIPQDTRKFLNIGEGTSVGFLVSVDEDVIAIMKELVKEESPEPWKWRK